ncbi:hypothetical protein NU118_003328 [Salmonella enterica]|nr:hypothetical protein [Salmonella enterica]EIX9960482.1 hypothetical protein [Salmonella enterica]EJP2998831.1 hypothetical protein [Salmonella enterica]EKI4847615.1 hypothetical protein [Salmonella enterica]
MSTINGRFCVVKTPLHYLDVQPVYLVLFYCLGSDNRVPLFRTGMVYYSSHYNTDRRFSAAIPDTRFLHHITASAHLTRSEDLFVALSADEDAQKQVLYAFVQRW